MVTIANYALRKREDGKEFYALILQGGMDLVRSQKTNRYYATIKKATISSTFDEATCKASIGQQFPGSIQKQTCEPYEYVAKETGEILSLTHRWVYVPEGETLEEVIFEGPVGETSQRNLTENAVFI
jgi:hypothetical protein